MQINCLQRLTTLINIFNLHLMNLTELHRYTDMLVICISTNTQAK